MAPSRQPRVQQHGALAAAQVPMPSDPHQSSSEQPAQQARAEVQASAQAMPGEEFRWLPTSLVARVAIGVAAAGFVAFVFSAYLHPNMVFDLANMVFCG